MSIEEKIEIMLSDGEYVAQSPIEAEGIVNRAKELGYNLSWRYFDQTEITIIKFKE